MNHHYNFNELLDAEMLNSLYEGDMEHAGMVFEEFVQLAPVQMKEIEFRYATGIVEPFREKVHKIKPVFSFVGLSQLTTKAELIEQKCRMINNISEIEELYVDFKNMFTVQLPVVKAELEKMKS